MKKNFAEFMQRQDMIWNHAPHSWDEGAFLGNGRCGLLVYQEPETERLVLELGRSDVYDNRNTQDGGMEAMYTSPRLPIGKVFLKLQGKVKHFSMRLDLYHAILKGTIETDKGRIDLEIFVHALEMLSLIRLTEEGEEKAEWEIQPYLSQSPRQKYGLEHQDAKRLREGYQPNAMPSVKALPHGTQVLQPLSHGAGYVTGLASERVEKECYLYLQVTIGDCLETLAEESAAYLEAKRQQTDGYEAMKKSHSKWWEAYYQTAFVTLPDKKMESFYWAQMYKAASATRSDGLVMDNQGPWLVDTCWPGTWWNLNVQLAYSPLYTANRLSVSESLWKNLEAHKEELIENIPEQYRYDSAGIHTATGRSYRSNVPEPGEQNGLVAFTELGNLTWALYDCFLYYRMKMDDAFLESFLYPMLRRSINYYLHFLTKREDGKWHLAQTSSPEYHHNCEDCNYDLSLLNWGVNTLLWITDRLKIEDPLREKWEDVKENITAYPQDEDGLFIGKGVKYEYSHRHYSHLLMIYPLHLLNAEQGEKERKLITHSLEWWQSKPELLQGYSYTGAASICASMGEGDKALSCLEGLWGKFLKPNTMYAESGPVIETPLAAAQVLNDMLLQSWGDKVRVFPAMPSSWKDAGFRELCAEGGFWVSAVRKDGKTWWIRIKSLAGEPLTLAADLQEPVVTGADVTLERVDGTEQETEKTAEKIVEKTAGMSQRKEDDLPQEKAHVWRIGNLKAGEEILIQEKGSSFQEEELLEEVAGKYFVNEAFYYGLPEA